MSTVAPMPRWDLTAFFPAIDSSEYQAGVAELQSLLDAAEKTLAEAGAIPLENPKTDAETAVAVVEALNALYRQARLVMGYASLTVSTDSGNDTAQAALSALTPLKVRLQKLDSAFSAWAGHLNVDELETQSPVLADHAFPLRKAIVQASHLMSPIEEALAADLNEPANGAWTKLYNDFSSNVEATVDGENIPVSSCRALAHNADQNVRREAYFAELEAWKANEIPFTACMNSIKGVGNILSERRGWTSQLAQTLFACNMDQASLDAMMSAAHDSFPHWRRFLRAKAKALGHGDRGLPFYDLFAPLGETREWSWQEGETFVEEGFRSYSDKLGDFARRSYEENWHDAPPQKGKRDGAFCAGVRDDESRMLHNFKPSFGSVSTLAHELGHAYHNLCLADRTPLQRSTPMTLAETASIFCETIIKGRALEAAQGAEKLSLLNDCLTGPCQVVVDITSRFLFESETIERRKERELSPAELCDIMRRAQEATYGDGLDSEFLHPYMWAAKPHYYSYMSFYNFPYMFGQLFALGLYKVYQESPEGFHDRYDDLLSSTGLYEAAELTQRFGIDIRDKAFWAGSLDVLKQDIDAFVGLVG